MQKRAKAVRKPDAETERRKAEGGAGISAETGR